MWNIFLNIYYYLYFFFENCLVLDILNLVCFYFDVLCFIYKILEVYLNCVREIFRNI